MAVKLKFFFKKFLSTTSQISLALWLLILGRFACILIVACRGHLHLDSAEIYFGSLNLIMLESKSVEYPIPRE